MLMRCRPTNAKPRMPGSIRFVGAFHRFGQEMPGLAILDFDHPEIRIPLTTALDIAINFIFPLAYPLQPEVREDALTLHAGAGRIGPCTAMQVGDLDQHVAAFMVALLYDKGRSARHLDTADQRVDPDPAWQSLFLHGLSPVVRHTICSASRGQTYTESEGTHMTQFPVWLIQAGAEATGETLGKASPGISAATTDVLLNAAGETTAAGILPLQTIIVILCCLVASALILLTRESKLEKYDS